MPSILDRFRRAAPVSALDPGDEQVIAQLRARGADLGKPRDTIHWLYFHDEASAEQAGRRLAAAGYSVDVAASVSEEGPEWRVRANDLAVVSPETLPAIRGLMEQVARELAGEYDGWEAAAEP